MPTRERGAWHRLSVTPRTALAGWWLRVATGPSGQPINVSFSQGAITAIASSKREMAQWPVSGMSST